VIAFLLAAALVTTDSLRLPPVAREFRGVWVATVGNIDWPSKTGLPVAQQQQELLAILDRAVTLRLNAVIFQVRPSGDALYESSIEPWSEYLSGQQGVAPAPRWDPLAFAVRESHTRGLELHAWFNPYRAKDPTSKSAFAPSHLALRRPTLVKRYGRYQWMDPGSDEVRRQTMRVILDVVQRYDIDGVHIDDYFYPYPERDRAGKLIPFPDTDSYQLYRRGGGTLAVEAWRRRNVDLLVMALHTEIKSLKPWVKFGISPFGIWRPGEPAGIQGFDAYEGLYADARRWMREGWLDYIAPQLYWPITARAQSYPVLLQWWGEQNTYGRHVWPGNFTSRVGTRTDWPASELLAQVRATRADRTATGNIHFSMSALMKNQSGIADAMSQQLYAAQALIPVSPWLPGRAPVAPTVTLGRDAAQRSVLCVTPAPSDTAAQTPKWWVVRVKRGADWTTDILPGVVNRWAMGMTVRAESVVVSGVDRTGREGAPVLATTTGGCSTDAPSGN
jgi:uncharacterized lipoprotein YddW (UPF0748 family)